MFKKFEILTSIYFLKSKQKDAFISVVSILSVLGVMLGVMALILITSLMGGFSETLLSRVLGVNGHVSIISHTEEDPNIVIDRIKTEIDENMLVSINPIIEKEAIFTYRNNSDAMMVRGIPKNDIENRDFVFNAILDDGVENFKKNGGVLIGERLAYIYNLKPGDSIKLLIPNGISTPFGYAPKTEYFKISGIFKIGMYRFDKSMIVMDFKSAESFFNIHKPNKYEIELTNPYDAFVVEEKLNDKFYEYSVSAWHKVNSALFDALKTEKNIMFIILTVMIMVATFNIITSQTMLVKEKKYQISVMRNLGVTSNSVVKIFFLTGFLLGFVGVLLGVIFGVLLTINIENIRQLVINIFGFDLFNPEIYSLDSLPTKIVISDIGIISFVSILIVIFASIYPAYKSGKILIKKGIYDE